MLIHTSNAMKRTCTLFRVANEIVRWTIADLFSAFLHLTCRINCKAPFPWCRVSSGVLTLEGQWSLTPVSRPTAAEARAYSIA